MTPREFIFHWHKEAGIAPPRFFPYSWEQHAHELLKRGIGEAELTLVARWMRAELRRSQAGERNSIAFNHASFSWRTMFGEFGASNQDENFVMRLAMAEAARKPAAAKPAPGTPAATPVDEAELARIRERNAEEFRRFQASMRGGGE